MQEPFPCVQWHVNHCVNRGKGNLRPRHPPHEYLGEYTSRGKPKIPPVDQILMDPGHKASKQRSDIADLGFQAVGIMYAYNAAQHRGVVSSISYRIREEEESKAKTQHIIRNLCNTVQQVSNCFTASGFCLFHCLQFHQNCVDL